MRLAEFKMRLLVFFAGALRKWAGTIEPTADEQGRRTSQVDDSSAVDPEARREGGAAAGPPEHWARLVTTAPPDHWLNLIREKAPHLLPANDEESVSTTAEGIPGSEPWQTETDQATCPEFLNDSGPEERPASQSDRATTF